MSDIEKRDYQLGLVKWFGGYNRQKDKENDFGFIQSMVGEDVFVHKNEIKAGIDLNEDELVIFESGERNGKIFAKNVHRPAKEPKMIGDVLQSYIKNKETFSNFFTSYTFQNAFKNLFNENFIENSNEKTFLDFLLIVFYDDYEFLFNKIDNYISIKSELDGAVFQLLLDNLEKIGYKQFLHANNKEIFLANEDIRTFITSTLTTSFDSLSNSELADLIANGLLNYNAVLSNSSFFNYAFENFESHKDFFNWIKEEIKNNVLVFKIIKETNNWLEIFRIIIGRKSIKTLLDSGLSLIFIPPKFIEEQEDKLYRYIEVLNENEKNNFFNNNIEQLPENIIIVCIIKGFLTNEDLINSRLNGISFIIERIFRENDQDLPDYVRSALNSLFENLNDFLSIRSIRLIIEPFLFKKSLYDKSPNTKQLFDQSLNLSNSIEHFILANLFPLIQAKNTIDISLKVFLHRLWESLNTKKIVISDVGLFKLFPSCSIMGNKNLSCEAFYWPKHEHFLCRGSICKDPKVLPNTDKHYLDFNIYDWFQHFGIDYVNEGNPSKKDFPIKLAGYINRLKEIFEIIQCRDCHSLMLPDMRYARVEYFEFDSEKKDYVKKDTSAAYRVTVFECSNKNCKEYGNKYYINHCLGFGCYSIIDSRDLKQKCKNGLYICRNCGSCCEECAKNHPNGFCPECGNNLILYEKNGKRFVYCSKRDCDFKISEENLSKKFFLQSAPVKKIN